MERESFETVQEVVVALNQRDVGRYLACCTDDVELIPATASIEGGYTGRSGIQRFFADLQDTAPDIQVEIERLKTVGQSVVAWERASASGRTSEATGEMDFTTVYEFAGPEIRRIQVFLDRQDAFAAAGLRE